MVRKDGPRLIPGERRVRNPMSAWSYSGGVGRKGKKDVKERAQAACGWGIGSTPARKESSGKEKAEQAKGRVARFTGNGKKGAEKRLDLIGIKHRVIT